MRVCLSQSVENRYCSAVLKFFSQSLYWIWLILYIPGLWSRSLKKFLAWGVGARKNVSTPTQGFFSFCFQQKFFSSLMVMEIDKCFFLLWRLSGIWTVVSSKWIKVNFVFQIYMPYAFQKNFSVLVWKINKGWFICMKFLMLFSTF